jgi:hypothetical protein
VQANILQQYCTVCHSGANPPAGLSWEVGQYATNVTNGRMSTEISTMREVQAGNPDASYMMWKLNGHGPAGQAIVGARMPATGIPLDPALIAVIAQWIGNGALLGDPADANSGPPTPPPPPPPPDPSGIIPTWYGVQANILQQYCTVCHSGATPPAGLSWEVGQYATIVTNGRMSTEISTLREVQPSNPDTSYMMWKLNGHGPAGQAIVGARMPATGIPLDPALIEVVAQWIRNGAPLGNPADANSGSSGPTFPVGSWMYVWTESLQVCTLCHSRTPSSERCGRDFSCPPKGVVLTADNYNGVVNGEEVRRFRPDNSKLWERVTANDPKDRMPFGLPPLSQRQLDIIFNWINNGAPLCPTGEVCP